MTHRWRIYDLPDVRALATQPTPWDSPAERACPACGARSVRYYIYEFERLGDPAASSYTWCANCRRYYGSTGPKPDGIDFTEPLSLEQIKRLGGLEGLLDHLNGMWDEGRLPQTFTAKSPDRRRPDTETHDRDDEWEPVTQEGMPRNEAARRTFYVRPPENFYELSEEEQLAWTRQVGEDLKAASAAEPAADSETDDGDQPGADR